MFFIQQICRNIYFPRKKEPPSWTASALPPTTPTLCLGITAQCHEWRFVSWKSVHKESVGKTQRWENPGLRAMGPSFHHNSSIHQPWAFSWFCSPAWACFLIYNMRKQTNNLKGYFQLPRFMTLMEEQIQFCVLNISISYYSSVPILTSRSNHPMSTTLRDVSGRASYGDSMSRKWSVSLSYDFKK